VLDIGTGRAFKLMKYFRDRETLGLDLPPTVEWLQSPDGYPDRKWAFCGLNSKAPIGYSLVICADVIEHVRNPNMLCGFIKRCKPVVAVISTPDRDLLKHEVCQTGPPFNGCHVREWNFAEFGMYMRDHFNVLMHWHPNIGQACQAVIVSTGPEI
jgi:hypothetical protein